MMTNTKNNLYILSIEPLESRYTAQWHKYLPQLLQTSLNKFEVIQLDGQTNSEKPTAGAFLDFAGTNCWKNEQTTALLKLIQANLVPNGSHVLITDAWNPTILELKYTSDLLGLDLVLHGLWHAGSWDSHDFLGRLIGNKPWVRNTERAIFYSLDHNYFATHFHAKLFADTMVAENFDHLKYTKKIVITGWPMNYLSNIIQPYTQTASKRNLILFPHRIAPEKQVDIFRDLAKSMPEYQWVVCQDQALSKAEYHQLLAEAKIVFSANLQETLGISTCAEATLANAVPLAPKRLSYAEIFDQYNEFLYPTHWTLCWDNYIKYKNDLQRTIHRTITNYDSLVPVINQYNKKRLPQFFTANNLINTIQPKEIEYEKNI